MKRILLLVVMGSTGLLGCGGAEEAGGSDEESIQGGARDAKDPAVGLVWIQGGGFCSGSLIAPDVVLTAGHCVESPVATFYTGNGSAVASVGRLPSATGLTAHAVVDQLAHPSYRSLNQCPNPSFDVALLRLAKPISGITPLSLATAPPKDGASCRAVGYGVHGDGASATVEQKRSATETVLAVATSSVEVTRKSGVVDHGDSGGPLLCGGHIAGVTSCGNDPSSSHTEAYYGRVDSLGAWVKKTVAAWK